MDTRISSVRGYGVLLELYVTYTRDASGRVSTSAYIQQHMFTRTSKGFDVGKGLRTCGLHRSLSCSQTL